MSEKSQINRLLQNGESVGYKSFVEYKKHYTANGFEDS